jgi:hypothetical protein
VQNLAVRSFCEGSTSSDPRTISHSRTEIPVQTQGTPMIHDLRPILKGTAMNRVTPHKKNVLERNLDFDGVIFGRDG